MAGQASRSNGDREVILISARARLATSSGEGSADLSLSLSLVSKPPSFSTLAFRYAKRIPRPEIHRDLYGGKFYISTSPGLIALATLHFHFRPATSSRTANSGDEPPSSKSRPRSTVLIMPRFREGVGRLINCLPATAVVLIFE